MNIKTLISVTAVGLAAALSAGAAQAHTDVRWSVSIGVPALPVYVQPAVAAPVYVEPAPVIYAPPPPPRPVYVQPAPAYGYGYGYGVVYREPTRWDRDADGVPDRYERHHHGRGWDRDRDGVPDRYDRRPDNPWRH